MYIICVVLLDFLFIKHVDRWENERKVSLEITTFTWSQLTEFQEGRIHVLELAIQSWCMWCVECLFFIIILSI